MLELLRIKQLALIDDLELEFSSGLNMITRRKWSWKIVYSQGDGFYSGRAD